MRDTHTSLAEAKDFFDVNCFARLRQRRDLDWDVEAVYPNKESLGWSCALFRVNDDILNRAQRAHRELLLPGDYDPECQSKTLWVIPVRCRGIYLEEAVYNPVTGQ